MNYLRSSMFKILSIFLCIQIVPAVLSGQVSYNDHTLMIKHDLFEKRIQVSQNGPGPVLLEALLDPEGKNVLADPHNTAMFEFAVDHWLVTALDPLWRYDGYSIRSMGNGGTEIIISIAGIRKPVRGLRLDLYQQIFPGTTLMREMISFQSTGKSQFKLNKVDGKLHFIFPGYSVRSGSMPALTEIRLASWASELIELDKKASRDDRFSERMFSDHNLAQNHMFHPNISGHAAREGEPTMVKGPIQVLKAGDLQWISTYEHASQDDLRGVLTVDRIRDEIERASELGVDIFVLDDGWEEAPGIWSPDPERWPAGLAPIKAELDK